MPELPEVETIRRDLERHLRGARVAGVRVLRPEVVVGASPAEFDRLLRGGRFLRFARRGKYLLFEVEVPDEAAAAALRRGRGARQGRAGSGAADAALHGTPSVASAKGCVPGGREPAASAPLGAARRPRRRWLAIHLRMTGRLTLARRHEPLPPHTHVVWELADAGPWEELRLSDPRRFGRVYLLGRSPLGRGPGLRAGDGARRQRDAGMPPTARSAGAGARSLQAAGGDPGRPDPTPPERRGDPDQPGPRPPEWRGDPGRPDPIPPGLRSLGPEPLGRRFTASELARRLAGRRAPIKAVLLDQRVVAGLGNIYADEALFRARLHPAHPAGSLSPTALRRLVRAVRRVLREALAAGGTTFSDYRDGLGRRGRFAQRLAVYGRAGEPCPRCGTPIAALPLAGRTAHFCPRCQPPPDAAGGEVGRGAACPRRGAGPLAR
ncbi:DNA-formamidopyrimidine glycosylase family protein [Thermaerobacter composti]|uniref:Formamidopyrimidine-DNA glycosylase n=1 Tax=Thermaerobacter composti TaxID=554949 RepID=A0ABZ0QPP4_9FIRM|nr:DNA-formamidopyrimidine glycosylase family protein [Thermaerobacter composti]WPD19456.1 DNA-formamidopyrimidine glycosylase family protein [Thermaerobacter composti]